MRNHKNRPPVVRKVVEVRVDGRRCVWARPTVADVYVQVLQAEAMMERVPDDGLAVVRREIGLLAEMMGQYICDWRRT